MVIRCEGEKRRRRKKGAGVGLSGRTATKKSKNATQVVSIGIEQLKLCRRTFSKKTFLCRLDTIRLSTEDMIKTRVMWDHELMPRESTSLHNKCDRPRFLATNHSYPLSLISLQATILKLCREVIGSTHCDVCTTGRRRRRTRRKKERKKTKKKKRKDAGWNWSWAPRHGYSKKKKDKKNKQQKGRWVTGEGVRAKCTEIPIDKNAANWGPRKRNKHST